MGRPVITRAVKRTRQRLAEFVGKAGLESIAVEAAQDFAERATRKLAARVRKRVARRKARKTPKVSAGGTD